MDALFSFDVITTPELSKDWIRWVSQSSSGRYLATSADDGRIQVWSADDLKIARVLQNIDPSWGSARPKGSQVNCVEWHPREDFLISASDDRSIRLWTLDKDKPLKEIRGFERDAISVAWSPQGDSFAAAFGDGVVRVFETVTLKLKQELKTFAGWAVSLSWSKDGNLLAVTGDKFINHSDGWPKTTGHSTTSVWSGLEPPSQSAQMVDMLVEDGLGGYGVSFSPNQSSYLIATCGTTGVAIWDCEANRLVHKFDLSEREPASVPENVLGITGTETYNVNWSPDGRKLAASTTTGEVLVWEFQTEECAELIEEYVFKSEFEAAYRTIWLEEEGRVATAFRRAAVVWDFPTGCRSL